MDDSNEVKLSRVEAGRDVIIKIEKDDDKPCEACDLSVVYKVGRLDGRGILDLPGLPIGYDEGCKFKVQLMNPSNTKVIIDTIDFELEYRTLSAEISTAVNAAAIKFGKARTPHQLFICLNEKSWTGWWIFNEDKESYRREIMSGSKDLLDSAQPVCFSINPGDVELIHGCIKAFFPGIYTCTFIYEYTPVGAQTKLIQTQPITVIKANG